MQQNDPLSRTVIAVNEIFSRCGGRGAIIGGIAFALTVVPRATKDVDALLLVSLDEPQHAWEIAKTLEFRLRTPDALDKARLTRFLRLVYEPEDVEVDLQIGIWPFDYTAVGRALPQIVNGIEVQVVIPEDLIIMKAVAGRPQDLADIDRAFNVKADLDKDLLRTNLSEFREYVERPELIDQIIEKYL